VRESRVGGEKLDLRYAGLMLQYQLRVARDTSVYLRYAGLMLQYQLRVARDAR
jgi:hypothetical protein